MLNSRLAIFILLIWFIFTVPPFSCIFSLQCLLAEDLHLASLEAETILEAGEFLETMQDYLDSSVISIIEDFSSLTEVRYIMCA